MKLEYYGGEGFETSRRPEKDEYSVKWTEPDGTHCDKPYASYTEAKKHYDSIDGSKAFWHRYTLVDAWTESE